MLQLKTRAALQAGSSCLPEVLQQSGLQQLQLSSSGSPGALLQRVLLGHAGSNEQLYAFRAAAAGLEPARGECESNCAQQQVLVCD
jgi:hypothetical protein